MFLIMENQWSLDMKFTTTNELCIDVTGKLPEEIEEGIKKFCIRSNIKQGVINHMPVEFKDATPQFKFKEKKS